MEAGLEEGPNEEGVERIRLHAVSKHHAEVSNPSSE
jgi:hypothetical protein